MKLGAVNEVKKLKLMIFAMLVCISLVGCKNNDAPVNQGQEDHEQQQNENGTEVDQNKEEVPTEESQDDVSSSPNEDTYVYVNQFSGYSVEFPKSWEGKYTIEESEEKSEVLYNSTSDMRAPILTIFTYSEEDWDKAKENTTLHEILTQNGVVFAYLLPMDVPYSDAEAEEYGKMVGEAKEVIKSFSLE